MYPFTLLRIYASTHSRILIGLGFLLSLSVFQAPSFLFISEAPVRADAVVLFVGGETGTREKEARQLLREGFADYLIIPATGQIKKRGPDGRLEAFNWKRPEDVSNQRTKELTNQKNWFVENTHIEVYEAKRLMDNLGLRSALFVSSPYHMRRIKVISGKVFQDQMTVSYMPTRYESLGKGFWLFNSYERKSVLTEYAKIAWFHAYSPFVY